MVGPGTPVTGKPFIRVENLKVGMTPVLAHFAPPAIRPVGISPLAFIDENVTLCENVAVLPFACLFRGAVIGDGTVIHNGVTVGHDAVIGRDCNIKSGVYIGERVVVGNRVTVHPNSVLGGDGFGYLPSPRGPVKIPQIGTIEVGDDVEIGACVTIDRSTVGRTRIGSGVKIDNLVQVGHNVTVGEGSILVAQVGIAGSTTLGRGCIVAGQSGITDHSTVGDGVIIGAKTGVESKNVPSGSILLGAPAREHREMKRIFVSLAHLPSLVKQASALEKRLAALEDRLPPA